MQKEKGEKMKILNITLENAFDKDKFDKAQECWSLKIFVGEQQFSLCERSGKLEISVDNTLILEPKSNNSIHVTEQW